jgi:photosystem II stability/assembly factor-like uncharacterized protein
MHLHPIILLAAASALAAAQSAAPSPAPAPAVWLMQDSGTTAGLRGIDSVDGTVAWASGTGGTILRTTDGGAHWQKCAIPDGDKDGATLDFRGVQAWDAKTAIVMSSGKGRLSRLYKTTDGCLHWKMILYNPKKEGFWDALYFDRRWEVKGRGETGMLLGDPVDGMFWLLKTRDSGQHWTRQKNSGLSAKPMTQGAFAASNSSLIEHADFVKFGSGGPGGAFVYSLVEGSICVDDCSPEDMNLDGRKDKWQLQPVPLGQKTDSSGIFAIASHRFLDLPESAQKMVVVGGDYGKPNEAAGTAAWSDDDGNHWTGATKPPHGYRSTVQWSNTLKAWITAGTNGSDISRDDGKTWTPLDDGNWNALSLPFIVGPNGRIARLNPAAF